MNDVKVISLDPFERAGFTFKLSGNNYDGGVLVVAKSDLFKYFAVRYFSTPHLASEWINDLVDSARSACRHIVDD